MVSFSKGLQLSPFSLDDLESALVHTTELDLTDELHILWTSFVLFSLLLVSSPLPSPSVATFLTRLHLRLLRVVFNLKKGGTLPKKAINKEYVTCSFHTHLSPPFPPFPPFSLPSSSTSPFFSCSNNIFLVPGRTFYCSTQRSVQVRRRRWTIILYVTRVGGWKGRDKERGKGMGRVGKGG